MKKILFSILFVALLGASKQASAQCSGAVIISNFAVIAPGNTVFYSFDWKWVQGNASIQVVDSCNGVFVGAHACLPTLKDSGTATHHYAGSFPTSCSGALTVALIIWTNNSCGGHDCSAASVTIAHSPLPVTFAAFTATRNKSNVTVNWSTVTEVNNSGFAVERNVNGSWERIAFVPSQSFNGNSSSLLNYSYSDYNNVKGVSQYRIKQIDLDAKASYSDIKAVVGENQGGRTVVYPNPSDNGKVNVVFNSASETSRDVTVTDMSGRIVKQLRGVTNNNVTIENLNPGIYSLRVVVPATGEQSVEKIVVNKR